MRRLGLWRIQWSFPKHKDGVRFGSLYAAYPTVQLNGEQSDSLGRENTTTMYLNAINLILLQFIWGIAQAVAHPLSSNDDPKALGSQPQPPQVTSAPGPIPHGEAIEGRQEGSWNTCSGYSLEGASGTAAIVACPAPYSCLVGDYNVSPYWACATVAGWYTGCQPYGVLDYGYPDITYW
jgi:hypothetical protein